MIRAEDRLTTNSVSEHVSTTLAKLRALNGITQAEAADGIGVSLNAYARWERGRHEPSAVNLVAIADFYGTSVDAIVGRGPIRLAQ